MSDHDRDTDNTNEQDFEPSPAPVGETKADAFKRMARARMNKVLNDIRLIGNLANKSSYEYTPDQVDRMRDAIIKAIAENFSKFEGKKSNKEEFDFDE